MEKGKRINEKIYTNQRNHNFCSKKCGNIQKRKTNKILYQDSEKTMIDVSTEKYKNIVCTIDTDELKNGVLDFGKWGASRTSNKSIYPVKRYYDNFGKLKIIRIQNFIMKKNINDKQHVVDHINGNTLDNRKSNLRICLIKDNAKNLSKYITNTSGYKGVSFRKDCNMFVARINLNNKTIYLGKYKTALEAAIIYNKNAKIHHGEFARLNIL